MSSVDPATLSVTHIFDGEEVVKGGSDGQQWVATFADATTAKLFIQFFRERNLYPGATSSTCYCGKRTCPQCGEDPSAYLGAPTR